MSRKFIPNGDMDFVMMASHFARTIAKDPERFEIAQSDCEELTEIGCAVFRGGSGVPIPRAVAIGDAAKKDSRAAAEKIVRHLGHLIRENPASSRRARWRRGFRSDQRMRRSGPARRSRRACGSSVRIHEASGACARARVGFRVLDHSREQAAGARCDWSCSPIGGHPRSRCRRIRARTMAGRPWYLRSYTQPDHAGSADPARADAGGVLGPMGRFDRRRRPVQATAVAWIEGGSNQWLPGGVGMASPGNKAIPILEDVQSAGPRDRDAKYSVAVLEVQYQLLHPHEIAVEPMEARPVPAKREARQLQGPAESEAA